MKKWLQIISLCVFSSLFVACQKNQNPAEAQTSTNTASSPNPATDTNQKSAAIPTDTNQASTLQTNKETNNTPMTNTNEVAVIKTSEGEMVIAFWPDVAPKTVENFKKLARQGFYDGTAFHRIIKGFMVQGGDPLSKTDSPDVGTGGPGYQIKAEFSDRPHVRGVISMARSRNPDSAGSQFFICLAPAPNLNGQYTDFGNLIKGDDVLEKIGNTPVEDNGRGERSRPVKKVTVDSIKIVPADSVK